MKVGEYVRTECGIERIVDIKEWVNFKGYEKIISTDKNRYETVYERSKILKSSQNIIDLIEVGDYVNGLPVCETTNNEIYVGVKDSTFYWFVSDIDSVVTKEQFSQMEYRIGE